MRRLQPRGAPDRYLLPPRAPEVRVDDDPASDADVDPAVEADDTAENTAADAVDTDPEPKEPTEPTGRPVTIAFAGDLVFEGMIRPQHDADPERLLDPIAPVFAEADLTVVNLETAVTERGDAEPKQCTFRAPPTKLQALRAAGVDVVSLANNHGRDFGLVGLFGAGRDLDEAFAPFTATVRGRDIAVIGATQVMDREFFDTWPATAERPGLAGRLADAGADIVVGTHAHRLQGAGMLGDTLIGYGLRNFVFYSRKQPGSDTGVLMVTVEGRDVSDHDSVPARMHRAIPRLSTRASPPPRSLPCSVLSRTRRAAIDLTVPLVPRQVLFGNPERAEPCISPDGQQLAWLAPDEGVLNVWVGDADLSAARPVTRDRDRGIRTVTWAHDGRHLLYLQDAGGDENWRLHAVDLQTDTVRDLTPFDGVQARVVALDRRFPDEVLVGLNRDDPELHDVYRLHLPSGELEKVFDNPGFVGFVVDADFQVRGGVAPTPDGGMPILVRDHVDAEWRTILDVGAEDALASGPITFTRDGSALWLVSSVDANAGRLVRYELATDDATVIAADPRYDVTDVRLHPDTREVQWVSFQRERLHHEAIDASVADDLVFLAAADHGDVSVVDHDHADRVWIVAYERDDGPVRYHRYDRDGRSLQLLFEARPALAAYELARMEPIRLTSRDGLDLHGYLTAPPGVEVANLATVLLVHGGPWHRDVWGYDAVVQWLANRGYLVLQVNFRGSTGYGKAFLNAGDREWGAAMHDDLIDAVDWAIAQGHADPNRVAIYGGSYGGYAALVGATLTPEHFACAVDLVGPSNLQTLIASIPPYWRPMIAQFHNRVGDPDQDADLLWDRSPLSRAALVSIPLLIAQGANDPRVKQAESEQIVTALRTQGIDHEYLLFEDEGHGFAKPENRMRFHAASEAFLARHLGGRHEP